MYLFLLDFLSDMELEYWSNSSFVLLTFNSSLSDIDFPVLK